MPTLRDHLRSDLAAARVVRVAFLFLLLPAVSGCSFLFVNGPPSGHAQMNYFSCTESDAGPILDAIGAGLQAVGTIAIAADPDAYEDYWDVSSGAAIASGSAWTILLGSAALVGFNKTDGCRAAKRALADRQASAQRSPPAVDTMIVMQRMQQDTGRRERPRPAVRVQAWPDTVAPDTLEIFHTEYTNPWLNRFDFRRDRESCKHAVEARLRGGPDVTEERFELLVRRCLAGKGWQRIVEGDEGGG